jgi:uncharacterized protein YbaR (Trm112 family)
VNGVEEGGLPGSLRGCVVCPDCRGELDPVREAWLCVKCERTFPVREGILRLLPRTLAEEAEAAEAHAAPDGTSRGYRQNYQQLERAERYNAKYRRQVLKRASTGREFRLIERLLGTQPRSRLLLDLPSGGGRLSPALAPFTDCILEADVAFGQILHGRRAAALATPQVWINASALDIPLVDRSVDGVVCVRLAHHLPAAAERERLVRELLRVSQRFVLMTFFDFDSTKNRLRRLRRRFDGKKPKITMRRDELAALAAESGFTVAACPPLSRLFSGHRYALLVRGA